MFLQEMLSQVRCNTVKPSIPRFLIQTVHDLPQQADAKYESGIRAQAICVLHHSHSRSRSTPPSSAATGPNSSVVVGIQNIPNATPKCGAPRTDRKSTRLNS